MLGTEGLEVAEKKGRFMQAASRERGAHRGLQRRTRQRGMTSTGVHSKRSASGLNRVTCSNADPI